MRKIIEGRKRVDKRPIKGYQKKNKGSKWMSGSKKIPLKSE